MHFVVLGLGSNRDFIELQPPEILKKACFELNLLLEHCILSSVYTSKAMYVEDQNDFYNMVVGGGTNLSPTALLDAIHKIEDKWGRNRDREVRNGPRTIDIDIELYGNTKVLANNLVIPHERISERQFVLIPLVEILACQKCTKLVNEYKYTDIPNIAIYQTHLIALKDQGVTKYCAPFTV